MDAVVRRRKVTAAVVAAIAAAATDVAYFALIAGYSETDPKGVEPLLIVYIVAIVAAALLGAAWIDRGQSAKADVVLITAAAGSGALGFIGIFSIGLGLLITAGLLLLATFGFEPHPRQPGDWIAPLIGAVGAVVVLIACFTISGVFWGS
jgi:drug/metabolite transporter (DMT)-like permease